MWAGNHPGVDQMTQTDRAGLAQEADEVVLVDDLGRPVGTAPRVGVHGTDTPRHLAFSLYLVDHERRVLLTRRALAKRTFGGVWTNACCGHPRPGEAPAEAARRRVAEELGVELAAGAADAPGAGVTPLLPQFSYRAVDASGMVENELCPVFWARAPWPLDPADPLAGLRLDPTEVDAAAAPRWDDLAEAVARTPFAFSPWMVAQVAAIAERGAPW